MKILTAILPLLIGCSLDIKSLTLEEGEGWLQITEGDCIRTYDQTWDYSDAPCDDCEFVAEVVSTINETGSVLGDCGYYETTLRQTVGYRLDVRAIYFPPNGGLDGFWVSYPGEADYDGENWNYIYDEHDFESDTQISYTHEEAVYVY